jgi:hypothetical protein
MTIQARDMMVQGDAVTNSETARGGAGPIRSAANLNHGAGGFVAEDPGRGDGAVMDFLDVGRANAARGDSHQQFVSANARHGHGFSAKIVRAAVNGGAHGFWNRKHEISLTTDGHGWTRIFKRKNCRHEFHEPARIFKRKCSQPPARHSFHTTPARSGPTRPTFHFGIY